MNSFIRTVTAPGLDEQMPASLNADSRSTAQFTHVSNRVSGGTAALCAPAEPCEDIWEALEELHRTALN